MRSAFTRGRITATFGLLALLVSVAGTHAAFAAPANQASAERSLSEAANAGYVAFSASRPTLTSDIGQPSDGAEWQLPVGIGLLAVGLLGLLCGLATIVSTRRRVLAHAVRAPTPGRTRRDTTMARQTGSGG